MATPKVFSLFKITNENGSDIVRQYEELFPNIITMGQRVDFFLECLSYDVIIPSVVRAEKRVDVFEEAVLRLIYAKSLTLKEMAEILCLTEDLINFIIIRLIEMNLLETNRLKLTEQGKEVLLIDSSVKDKVDYLQGKIFVLKKTGEILPYIHIGEFKSERVTDYSQSSLKVEFGTIGKAKVVQGKCIRGIGTERPKTMLQTAKIRDALKRYNKIVMNKPAYKRIFFDEEWAISSSLSDNVYLHMQAIVQKGNVDEILISDGFVENIDFVNKYIARNFSEFKMYVQEKNAQIKISEIEMEKVGKNRNTKYPELDRLWRKVEKDYDKLEQIEKMSQNVYSNDEFIEENKDSVIHESQISYGYSINAQDIVRDQRFKQKAVLLNAYSCFEWVFFSYIKNNPLSDVTYKLVLQQGRKQNRDTILEVLSSIGINVPERVKPIFGMIDKSKIRKMYQNNTPEFRCSLGLVVLSIIGDDKSLAKKLIRDHKFFLYDLYQLFDEHGDLSHSAVIPEYDMGKIRNVYSDLRISIKALLPDFIFSTDSSKDVVIDKFSQERLDSIVCLSKELGSMYFNNILPKNLRDEWIQIAPNVVELPDVIDYVEIMYRIMQDTLFQENLNIKKNVQLTREDVLVKLKERGIKSACFDSINERFIVDSLKNINSSLGANTVVYLFYQNANDLDTLKQLGVVELIETLVKLRKHGGNICLNVDVNEMNKIRNNLMNIVRYIGGK